MVTIIGDPSANLHALSFILAKVEEDPQSGSCLNISYADVQGLVANFNPTGSPFAQNGSAGSNAGGGAGGGGAGGGGSAGGGAVSSASSNASTSAAGGAANSSAPSSDQQPMDTNSGRWVSGLRGCNNPTGL